MNNQPTNQPPEQEYEPFGDYWVKEVKKLPKDFLIEQWKQSRLEIQQLKAATPPATVIQPLGLRDENKIKIALIKVNQK